MRIGPPVRRPGIVSRVSPETPLGDFKHRTTRGHCGSTVGIPGRDRSRIFAARCYLHGRYFRESIAAFVFAPGKQFQVYG